MFLELYFYQFLVCLKKIMFIQMIYKEKQKIYNFNKEMFIFGDVKVISRTTITRAKDYYTKKANIKDIMKDNYQSAFSLFATIISFAEKSFMPLKSSMLLPVNSNSCICLPASTFMPSFPY